MFSRKFSQWPVRSQRLRSRICGRAPRGSRSRDTRGACTARPAARAPSLSDARRPGRRFLLHVEKIELRAEAPVVALLGFLQHLEVGVLVLLLPQAVP